MALTHLKCIRNGKIYLSFLWHKSPNMKFRHIFTYSNSPKTPGKTPKNSLLNADLLLPITPKHPVLLHFILFAFVPPVKLLRALP